MNAARTLSLALAVLALAAGGARAQLVVDFSINTSMDTGRISPYVYGSNGHSEDRDENITARRLGGNRLTGYNWENNASNAGVDYLHQNDNYLTSDMPGSVQNTPGIVVTSFHDTSLALGCYSVLTLPAAGFVARDKRGPVSQAEAAPSPRWRAVVFAKGAPFATAPDTSDGSVYVDEEVNMLVVRYGPAGGARGVRGYAVDNEPDLWASSHPRLHPQRTTIAEIIDRTVRLAKAVKDVDPAAEIFGATSYGYSGYLNFQDAPDWNQYNGYGTYLNAFVEKMKEESAKAGRRLLDVLDLHWYPEARGRTISGMMERVALSNNDDPGVAWARMQAPRTLWDSAYVEDSWIGQYFSPVALLPALRPTMARYPGTKIAFTEFNYGGEDHISGGIATADVLGIFGARGVYMANHWGAIAGYTSAAYRIYRNYDGARSTFGDVRVAATTSNVERSAVHASLDSSGRLHIVAINRDTARAIDATISVAGARGYTGGAAYGFTRESPEIRPLAGVGPIVGGRFVYSLPALSVVHFVLEPSQPGTVDSGDGIAGLLRCDGVVPNPSRDYTAVRFTLARTAHLTITVFDALGRPVLWLVDGVREAGAYAVPLHTAAIPPGAYTCLLRADGVSATVPVVVVR